MSGKLFTSFKSGAFTFPNRVIMAPLTRMRATPPGDVPNELMQTYYVQRASAGLIIAEATQISPQGKGYMDTPGIYSAEQVAGWKKITDAVHAAGGHIALQLWRIKQRELPVEIHDMNFPEMVDESIFSVQDTIGKKPLTISQRFGQPFPKIRSDVAKLGQILFLLLDNAVRFTPSGEIEIAAKIEDGQLLCSVKDTGIGICPDDQQYIFDEFYQVDDSAAQHSRGAVSPLFAGLLRFMTLFASHSGGARRMRVISCRHSWPDHGTKARRETAR